MTKSRLMTRCVAVLVLLGTTAFAQQHWRAKLDWKTWVIPDGTNHGVARPPRHPRDVQKELFQVRAMSRNTDPAILDQIRYWNAGPPSYRWMDLITQRQIAGQSVGKFPFRATTYVSLAIYDATVAAWNAKLAYRRERPSKEDPSIRPRVAVPQSFSYPSDYAATATAAATVMAHLVPEQAEYFHQLAREAGMSRVYAGVEYPSDYEAGAELGRRVAEQVIAKASADGSDAPWTGTVPTGPCMWTGTNPGNVTAATWKPILLTSPSEFRPPAPPACDSAEVQDDVKIVREFPRSLSGPNFGTNARAFYWQTPEGVFPWAFVHLNRWVLEDQLEMDPPQAARAYALLGAAGLDSFIASQDGKFAYWYLRPAQLDPAIVPLFPSPNFPSYPSNHSTLSTARSEVLAYLFPERAEQIRALGKEAGDSRIWAGIHYPMDNVSGVALGKAVAQKFIEWAQNDGSQR